MGFLEEHLIGRNLKSIVRSATECTIEFDDGIVVGWSDVKLDLLFGEEPLRVTAVTICQNWVTIELSDGMIRIDRTPRSDSPESWMYRNTNNPPIIIVDRAED